jgi:hypothetical protein
VPAPTGKTAFLDVVTVCENINDLSAVWFGDEVLPDYADKYLTDYYLGFRHRPGLVAGASALSLGSA